MATQLVVIYRELKGLGGTANYRDPKIRLSAIRLRECLPKNLDGIDPKSIDQIKALVLLSEVHDYFGELDRARQVS